MRGKDVSAPTQYAIVFFISEKNQMMKSPILINANKIKKIPLVINCILKILDFRHEKLCWIIPKLAALGKREKVVLFSPNNSYYNRLRYYV